MYTFLSIVIIIVSIFLIAAVLMQNSKGGGLTQNFASQQQIMGVRKTTEFLEKVTWTLAISIAVLSFISVAFMDHGVETTSSAVDDLLKSQQTAAPATPSFPTQAPAESVELPTATEAPATEAPATE